VTQASPTPPHQSDQLDRSLVARSYRRRRTPEFSVAIRRKNQPLYVQKRLKQPDALLLLTPGNLAGKRGTIFTYTTFVKRKREHQRFLTSF
jgi:hypothetical protein